MIKKKINKKSTLSANREEKPARVSEKSIEHQQTLVTAAEKLTKEKMETEVLLRKKYEALAKKIKNVFPQGGVVVNIKENEEEIQLAFGKKAQLDKIHPSTGTRVASRPEVATSDGKKINKEDKPDHSS